MSAKGLIAVAALVAIAIIGGVATVTGNSLSFGLGEPRSNFTREQAANFREFDLYNAGEEVAGLPLVAVLRRNDPPTNWVSFIYGTCQPQGGVGCSPPAEVQVWPACLRNPASFAGAHGPQVRATLKIRGVPGRSYEPGDRLEIQAGASTIVIFGQTPELVRTIAEELRGVNVDLRPPRSLPPPAQGVMSGTIRCS